MSNYKQLFMLKRGPVSHIDDVLNAGMPSFHDRALHAQYLQKLQHMSLNPALTHEHHLKMLKADSPRVDRALIEFQPNLHPDVVTEIAHKNGTFVGTQVANHPNVTSEAMSHVLASLDGGANHPDYANSKVVTDWKAKRDALKAAGK